MPPPVMVPPATGEVLAVRVYLMRVKFAVTGTLGSLPRVTTVQVPPVPLQPPPDQPVNRYRAACATACETESVTDSPQFTVLPPLTVPPAAGEAEPVTVHCWRVKFAVKVKSPVGVILFVLDARQPAPDAPSVAPQLLKQ